MKKTHPPFYPRVTIPGSELRTLESSATGRCYDLYIHFPGDYAQQPDKAYPVLYVLDGQWDFKLLVSVFGGLLIDGFVPEMLIVGVTYSGESPEYETLRLMDDTPVAIEQIPGSGGAPKFLAFFKDELIPFIATNYRADSSQRILLGSSAGGLFTLFALFEDHKLFSGYIAASPAVPYGDNALFKQEAQYAAQHQDLPVKLFISAGEQESLAHPIKEYIKVINERGYQGLQMNVRILEGERHASIKPEAYNRGLRFIFQEGNGGA
jgi:predicted alpha/beta superfamily hydrolase